MTYDTVALCRSEPDAATMIGALVTAGSDLKMDTVDSAGLVQLFDSADGRLLLTVETARLVQVHGEAERLLGVTLDDSFGDRVWWVESRAPGGDPRAADVARRFTTALVSTTGGLTWVDR
ncbi:hypothetical protein [Micromonospora chokoriensis]|uniref:hypothetical protein n=1 Tax=Micromonospora chokoriensis TaxID=356851 RepID=UPI000B5AC1F2|nr:hypothetical protein [Micromonospora chokoriensis]